MAEDTPESGYTSRGKKCVRRRSYLLRRVHMLPFYMRRARSSALASVIEYISLMQSNLLFNTNNWKFRREKKTHTRAPENTIDKMAQ